MYVVNAVAIIVSCFCCFSLHVTLAGFARKAGHTKRIADPLPNSKTDGRALREKERIALGSGEFGSFSLRARLRKSKIQARRRALMFSRCMAHYFVCSPSIVPFIRTTILAITHAPVCVVSAAAAACRSSSRTEPHMAAAVVPSTFPNANDKNSHRSDCTAPFRAAFPRATSTRSPPRKVGNPASH